jgi:eukaryotic-like serine/threonine-protein kinase
MGSPSATAKTVFFEALEVASAKERQALLDARCGGNVELRRAVEELLRHHEQINGFLEAPPTAVAKLADTAREKQATCRKRVEELLAAHDAMGMIGAYKLLQVIGEGGMGVVYLAKQTEPVQREVALKIIKPGMDSRQVIARFEAERQVLASMDHPNIAKVLDAGTTENGQPFFVMELVNGVPITKYCDDQHLSVKQRLELMSPVCQAIQHAHQKGIIHRDIKPTNILVAQYGGQPVPKVIDFGVAKATAQELAERTMFTELGQVVGTLEYMSPEQAELNQLDIDTRSDIYSLGVLFYELLTGTTPFDKQKLLSAAFHEMLRIIREDEPPKPSTRLSTIDTLHSVAANRQVEPGRLSKVIRGELDWIVMKALEKDRSRRYESASSLAADVQRYLHDEPVQACPPSAVYRFRKFAHRHQRALAMFVDVGMALVASVATLAVAYFQVNQKQQQTQAALERERQALYYNRIALADSSYWLANDVGHAERLLGECPQEFRHWEWHYLQRLCHANVLTLPHPSPVISLAHSADGQRLATGSANTVTIWDNQTGRQLLSLRGHTGNVGSLSFSPDGKQLASASDDQTVKVWDTESGEEIRTLRGHLGRVRSVVFSPPDKMLAGETSAQQWLASAGQDQTIRFWDVASGEQLFSLQGHAGPVRAVAFSPDGQRLASASDDNTVKIWDVTQQQEVLTLRGHAKYVACVAFHPEGMLLASGSYDWTARIWDLATGQEVQTLSGHKHYVSGIDFSPDGKQLATASYDQTIKLWDVASGVEVQTLRGHTQWVQQVAFCDGGRRLVSGGHDRCARIWDPAESQPVRTIVMPRGEVHHAAFSPDGRRLATAGGDNNVRIWDAATGHELLTLRGHAWRVWHVAFSPDGKLLASAGGRRGDPDPADVKIWDAATGSELLTLSGHTRSVRRVAFSPDGRRLASASHDHTVKLWDVGTGRELYTLPAHTAEVMSVAFSPSGRQLASASFDQTVKLWDAATGQLARTFWVHNDRIYDVAFSSDGQRLAAVGGTMPSYLKIWDAVTGDEIHSLVVRTGAQYGLAFSPDNRRIATINYDATVRIWDAVTGQETLMLRGHTDQAWGAAFSPDGWRLATASYDGTAKIWDATPMTKDEAPIPKQMANNH